MAETARLVDPGADVGSVALAAALAARDPAALAQALRDDWVVVPVRERDGATEIRLFAFDTDADASSGTAPRWELPLFSSAATLAAFLADEPERRFEFVRGRSLTGFLADHRDVIARVVFDPAGTDAVAVAVDDLIAALVPAAASGDAAATGDGGAERSGIAPDDRAVDLVLPFTDDWFVIDLTDTATVDDRIAELVDRQLAGLEVGATLRTQLRQWLRRMMSAAIGGRGREVAFMLRRTEQAAVALSLTRYWQPLGARPEAPAPLDEVIARLQARLREADELVGAELPAGRFVRHTRLGSGDAQLGASDIPVLAIDYWLEFPDRRGLCLVSFSTPHSDLRESILALTDEMVTESAWVVHGAAAPAADAGPDRS